MPPLFVSEEAPDDRILIVAGSPTCPPLCPLLREEFPSEVRVLPDGRGATELCLVWPPDVILVGLPGTDGAALVEELRQGPLAGDLVPILLITGDRRLETRLGALRAGATDVIEAPVDLEDLLHRVRNHLRSRALFRQIYEYALQVEKRIDQKERELEASWRESIALLAQAAQCRDDDTADHALRVAELAARLANEVGLPIPEVEMIWQAAVLHDLGKIGVTDAILNKPGKLTPEEMATMRTHAEIGASILSEGSSEVLQMAERIARTHHEWWDGRGYTGLRGEEIPLEGRITAVADVYDALIHDRPYHRARSVVEAVRFLVRRRGTQFDARLVDALVRVLRRDGILPPAEGLSLREEEAYA